MQTSIYLMLSVAGVLSERRIEGNVFQLQTRLGSSVDESLGDPGRIQIAAIGVHRADGSISDEVTLNWIIGSVMGIASARPLPINLQSGVEAEFQALSEDLASSMSMAEVKSVIDAYEREHRSANQTSVNELPRTFDGTPMSVEEVMMGGHISPVLIDITGPAVDESVIFPAQYGSPDVRTEGWYWSATVDTNKVGIHQCDLHVMVYRPRLEESTIMWDPEVHVLEMEIQVSQITEVNGFTGGGIGYLPLVEPRSLDGAHV